MIQQMKGSKTKGESMDRAKKVELIQRSLGIRHKLKVHGSMEQPETHEELSVSLLAKWELEDELHAIEQILAQARQNNVADKIKLIEQGVLKKGKTTTKKTTKKKA
jgi:hypothetical protein